MPLNFELNEHPALPEDILGLHRSVLSPVGWLEQPLGLHPKLKSEPDTRQSMVRKQTRKEKDYMEWGWTGVSY